MSTIHRNGSNKGADDQFSVPWDEGNSVIPRIIHQTFMTKNLPVELQENVDNIKKLNPGWVHILYDDDDIEAFIRENYGPVIFGYYEQINPKYGVARADFFRYLLMYKCGGVYLDIKSTCTGPLDHVLNPKDKYILAQWRNKPGEIHAGYGIFKKAAHIDGGEYQQWHIVTVPGHPFLKAVISAILHNFQIYRPWLHGTGGIGVLRLTGPLAYTIAINPLLGTNPYRLVKDETAIGLQYSVYTKVHHRSVYKTNYSTLTESILQLRKSDRFLGILYSFVKKSKHVVFGK